MAQKRSPKAKPKQEQNQSKGPLVAWVGCGAALMVLAFMFGTMVGDGGAANPPAASTPESTLVQQLPDGARQVNPEEVPEHIRNATSQEPGTRAPVEISPATINLGTVQPNDRKPATAQIRNVGTDPLTIRSTRANCGCTTVDMAGTVIAPGRSVPIEASFRSSTIGSQTATITVLFEGYDEPERVTINANVAG